MILLTEMQKTVGGRLDCGILVGFGPSLNDRRHEQCKSTRAQHPQQFPECFAIIDVFKHMRADNHVERPVGEVETFNIEYKISPTWFEISGLVVVGLLLDELLDGFLWRKMQDGSVALHDAGIVVEPKRQKPVPFEATTLRATCIIPRGMAKASKESLEATETAFTREHPLHSRQNSLLVRS
jgi:hypothetical protein